MDDRYCRWLASHLRLGSFPLNREQERYAESLPDCSPASIVGSVAEDLAEWDLEYERLGRCAREGTPYAEILRHERECWMETFGDEAEPTVSWEEFKTSEQDYIRIGLESKEFGALPAIPPHLDICVRPLLAIALKKSESDEQALRLIHIFYGTFDDTITK